MKTAAYGPAAWAGSVAQRSPRMRCVPKRPSTASPPPLTASMCARRPRSVTGHPAAASSPPTTEPSAPAPAIRISSPPATRVTIRPRPACDKRIAVLVSAARDPARALEVALPGARPDRQPLALRGTDRGAARARARRAGGGGRGPPPPPLDWVFTICEEVGLLGAKHLDLSRVRARRGLVFDSDAVGLAFTRAPGANHLEVVVRGKAAHAGMAPERGVSAIQVAAEAIAAMRLGRIDAETTANIGRIEGGRATNIVPDEVRVRGEARSPDLVRLAAQTDHMRACFEEAAARHPGARVEVLVEAAYAPMAVAEDSAIMRLVAAAAARTGRTITAPGIGRGCDANVLNRRGLEGVNLGTGMRDIHTTG